MNSVLRHQLAELNKDLQSIIYEVRSEEDIEATEEKIIKSKYIQQNFTYKVFQLVVNIFKAFAVLPRSKNAFLLLIIKLYEKKFGFKGRNKERYHETWQ